MSIGYCLSHTPLTISDDASVRLGHDRQSIVNKYYANAQHLTEADLVCLMIKKLGPAVECIIQDFPGWVVEYDDACENWERFPDMDYDSFDTEILRWPRRVSSIAKPLHDKNPDAKYGILVDVTEPIGKVRCF